MAVEIMPNTQPDAFVVFDLRAIEDRAATKERGYACFSDEEFAIITPPGGSLVVEKAIKDFTPRDWERFKTRYDAWKAGTEMPEDGIPLRRWPLSTPSFLKMAAAATVRTVEELAEANENTLEQLGMGSRNWKQKAEAYLAHAADGGKVAEQNAQMAALIDDQAQAIERLTKEVAELKRDMPAESRTTKRGRSAA